MLDILCVGDAVIDIFLSIPEENPHFGLDKEKNKLYVSYGEKINIEKYVMDVGGNASNTSVGLARLGFNVGICAEIGVDELSKKILDKLEKEKIDMSLLLKVDKKKTSFSVGINYKGERTLFVEHVERDHSFELGNVDTKFIYLTSLGKKWEKAYEEALQTVKEKNIKLAFNPGTLQLERRDRLVMEIIENTDFLFVNKEEAQELLYGTTLNSTNDTSFIKKLLFGLKSLGAKNVLITDSSRGAFAYSSDDQLYKSGTLDVKAIEKTGAGDAFTSGFLGAVISGKNVEEAMIMGTLEATNVIQHIGAQEGLLSKEEMESQLRNTTLEVESL